MRSSFEDHNPSRTVRVFISSTFRDMQAERDYLVKHVFPELRARCKARQVEFVEVDLRWGITEKQAESGETLPRCLEIINTCRPYFIGILGERYGWIPQLDSIPKHIFDSQPWLKEHLDASVTELEILHGVLNNPDMAGRAFFYFRDPAFNGKVPLSRRADFKENDPALQGKLNKLKSRIRENRHRFPVREGYPDPKALGKLVLDDLWQAIDRQFPPLSVPDDIERLAAEHHAFAASRAMLYTPLGNWQERLDDHTAKPSPPMVITGESGIGKSALLAYWALNYRKEHPDCLVLDHYIGVSRESARPEMILRRFMGEMKRFFTIAAAIPEKPEELVAAFPSFLSEASYHGHVILVIDALNQLDEGESPFSLSWLPTSFPVNVHVILSTTQGLHLEQAGNRGWRIAVIEPPAPVEIRRMIDSYLKHYLKNMEPQQIDRIVAATQAHNPLYLRVLLDELRITALHENLSERLTRYLQAGSVAELFDRVLERWERDYNGRCTGLVQDALSLLAVSHRGLSERELLELLGNKEKNLPLPQARWAPFYLAANEFLVNRSGYFWFFHDHFRQAVESRYLPTPGERCETLSRLANYYSEKISRDEEAGGAYRTLALAIAEDEVACAEKTRNKRVIATSYLNCSGTLISAAMGISDANVRHFDRMIALLHKGSELARQAKAWDILADALCRRAGDETERNPEFGRYDLIDEAIQLRRKRRNAEGVRDALRDKARIGMRTGRLDITEESLREADKIQRRLKQPDPQWKNIHGHQYWGECFAMQGRWPEAVEKLSLALKGARRFSHQGGITAATGWLGLAWCHLGEVDKGVQLIRSAMARERDILQSQEGVGKWLIEIGRFLDGNGETERALHAFWLADMIYEDMQHTALRRTKEILVKIAVRVPEKYAALRTLFNPFTVEFAPFCSLWGLPPLRQSPRNPVLQPQGDSWESRAVFNPAAWSDDTTLHILYQAEGTQEYPVIGHASSSDGCNFERVFQQPLLAPSEPWKLSGGYADPRLVFIEEENAFYLTYTFNRDGIATLALARTTDPNLRQWEILGPMFSMDQLQTALPHHLYTETPLGWSRSGAIYPKRINGLFWMYFGDNHIWAACSRDLSTWDIVPKPVLSPRPGHFDAARIEPGPPPVLLAEGLLLVYNGAYLGESGQLVYTVGQALFDPTSPTRVLRRSYNPILSSETVNAVPPRAIFAEGLTIFKESWRLFYGMENRNIGVASGNIVE